MAESAQVAVLGLDLGSVCSKITLAVENPPALPALNPEPEASVRIFRIHPKVTLGDLEKTQLPFLGQVCLPATYDDKGSKIVPQAAPDLADYVPLKTILTHRAGLPIENLLKWKELMIAQFERRMMAAMQVEALEEHFKRLRDEAVRAAKDNCLTITAIVVSYPNYLSKKLRDDAGDLKNYLAFYLGLLRPLWADYETEKGMLIRFGAISEARATALYVSEPFEDASGVIQKDHLRAVYEDIDQTSGLTVITADSGSSTLSLQAQNLYADAQSGFNSCQSSNLHGYDGSTGSRYLLSDAVTTAIIRELQRDERETKDLITIFKRFEELMVTFDPDYDKFEDMQSLYGTYAPATNFSAKLTREQLHLAYQQALFKIHERIEDTISHFVEKEKDVVVFFCGGNYQSPWLRRHTSKFMDEVQQEAARMRAPVRVRYAFLADYDRAPLSAVSAGAAISAMHLPVPELALRKSAIGMQMMKRTPEDDWIGMCRVKVLLAMGHPLKESSFKITDPGRIKLRLICDPGYNPDGTSTHDFGRAKIKRKKTSHMPPIRTMGNPSGEMHGTLPYGLGFEIDATELPPDKVSVQLGGFHAREMARGVPPGNVEPDFPRTSRLVAPPSQPAQSSTCGETSPTVSAVFKLGVNIFQLDDKGQRTKHERDQRLELTLATDLVSKLPVVKSVKRLPAWCKYCGSLITLEYYGCVACPNHALCDCCFEDVLGPEQMETFMEGHREHGWSWVEIDVHPVDVGDGDIEA